MQIKVLPGTVGVFEKQLVHFQTIIFVLLMLNGDI